MTNFKKKVISNNRKLLYKILEPLKDELVIKLQYKAALGRKLDLSNPSRFTEKIQWYKLNYRTPLMTNCSDKYEVRNYLTGKGYNQYLPILFQVCNKFEEIDFESLPNSFVIKCNKGSGTNIIVKDKKQMNLNKVSSIVKSWDEVNTLSFGREWAYKNIIQKIVIEELLVNNDSPESGLNDYKILCFNGKPHYAWVDINRHNGHKRNFYDLEWSKLNVISDHPNSEQSIEKPYGFEKMIEISREVSKEFPFVRVDFYSINSKIYIGELTFYPWSGTVQFTPDKFDYDLGELFILPLPNAMEE